MEMRKVSGRNSLPMQHNSRCLRCTQHHFPHDHPEQLCLTSEIQGNILLRAEGTKLPVLCLDIQTTREIKLILSFLSIL